MPYKIRVQKKKQSAPLRLVSRSEELIDQARTHKGWIWGGAGVLALLAAAFLTLWFLNQRANEKAAALEAEAGVLFHEPPPPPQPKENGKEPPKEMTKTERLQKSAGLYEEILKDYPRTPSAPVAQYELGAVQFELKNYDDAEKAYQAFLEKYPGNKDLGSFVHLKLGYLYQAKGDDAAALKEFRLVYEAPNAREKDQAGFEVGRLLEKGGSKKEATEMYQKISQDFSLSPWGAEAKGRLALLNPPAAQAPAAPNGANANAPMSQPGQVIIPLKPQAEPLKPQGTPPPPAPPAK